MNQKIAEHCSRIDINFSEVAEEKGLEASNLLLQP
jgi:hypothetical protein